MNRHNKPSQVKKASADTTLLAGGGAIIGIIIVLFVIIPVAKGFLGLAGGTNAGLDKGFSDLIAKIEMLEEGMNIMHVFTVDKGYYYVVGFDAGNNPVNTAIKPPECEGKACFCVCIDEKCEKSADTKSNRGRDCRILEDYDKIVAEGSGVPWNSNGHFFVAGVDTIFFEWERGAEKNVAITLSKTDMTLNIGPVS